LQTLLGFDYGRQRIGVAVGQGITGTASALCTVGTVRDTPDWLRITTLINEWRPEALVVGLPRHADGSDSDSTQAARTFAQQLEARYRLPVFTMDERLSSHAAAALLQRDGRNASTGLDAVAARIILQDWLDTRNP
jgi:putative Holliday junction resolvase